MQRQPAPIPIPKPPTAPGEPDSARQQRNLVGVMASYIQDLTHPG